MTPSLLAVVLLASWESHSFDGKMMADGKRYYPTNMVAASWEYPLGSTVRVTDIHNGCSVVVMVTDRPNERFRGKRIDLSTAAFEKLNALPLGVCEVRVSPH